MDTVTKQLETTTSSLHHTTQALQEAEDKIVKLTQHTTDVEAIYSKEIKSLQSDLNDMTTELNEQQVDLQKARDEHSQKEKDLSQLQVWICSFFSQLPTEMYPSTQALSGS